jgi:hypothetical protein
MEIEPKPLENRIYDGARAREVLENEAYIAAFATVEQTLIERWKESPARDDKGREKLWDYLYALRQVDSALRSVMATVKLADRDLEHKRTLQQRAADTVRGWGA